MTAGRCMNHVDSVWGSWPRPECWEASWSERSRFIGATAGTLAGSTVPRTVSPPSPGCTVPCRRLRGPARGDGRGPFGSALRDGFGPGDAHTPERGDEAGTVCLVLAVGHRGYAAVQDRQLQAVRRLKRERQTSGDRPPRLEEKRGTWRMEEKFVNAVRGTEKVTPTTFEDGVRQIEFTEAAMWRV